MSMYLLYLRRVLLIAICTQFISISQAQNGDQILDGIGETGLIARYVFDGDVKDWSRNNLHAKFNEGAAQFVTDKRFGKVLSLTGDNNAFLTLPAEALTDLESLSISGWILLRSNQPEQYFFDFGKATGGHFFAAPAGTNASKGLQAAIATDKGSNKGTISPVIPLNTWVHLVIVVNVAAKKILTYTDSKLAGQAGGIAADLQQVFGRHQPTEKLLYIGKAISAGNASLNALLHDVRIYRVALNNKQVAGIFKNAQKALNEGSVNTTEKDGDDLPHFATAIPQFYNPFLTAVPDITLETEAGNLPRLPAFVTGMYSHGIAGPKVRVVWPAPTDNSAVLKPGQYTVTGQVAGSNFRPKAIVTVKQPGSAKTPVIKLQPFALDQVSLSADRLGHETKFIENRDKFITALANADPNTFLYMFRHAYGLKQPAGTKPLGVWDSEDTKLRGHATGHYLTAIAQAYAGTAYNKALQAKFAEKMDYMVNTLYNLSQLSGTPKEPGGPFVSDPTAVPPGPGKTGYDSELSEAGIRNDYWNWGKGFISAYPPDQFIMLEKGAKYGGKSNQVWAPYYTLHKILSGLLDVYEVSGNKKALDIATGMGNWVYARLSKVPTDTLIKMWNTYIAGEFGGMNEAMARLYRITGNADYLKTAQLFDNIKVFFGDTTHIHGLAKNVDLFRGLHANQHIPQIVGSIETYRATSNPEYFKIADNFWYKMVNDYMYSIGGVAGARNPANAECLVREPGTLYQNGFSAGGQNETCATYNMLKLTSDLFLYDQRGELMDYYERGLYNHILASVAENNAGNTYHVPLRPGSAKQFSNEDLSGFTCCNGTALESSTKLQNSIYFKSTDNNALYVNLFIPSVLQWKGHNIVVEQTTSFPYEDKTRLTIKGNGKFDIHVRVPAWATKGFFVTINGKPQALKATPGSYLTISKNWNSGDVIDLKMPFTFHLEPVMDQQNIASLFYGPILLAAQEPEARTDWRKITLNAKDISKSIKGDSKQLQFTIDGVPFKPFYESYDRYSVYLDVSLK